MEDIKTTVSKNKEGYGYKYTDLAQIHDYLEGINARYIQQVKRIENDDYVMTKRCFGDVWEDEWLQGAKIVDAVLNGIKNPAQEQGSALTYARRYSLLMAFGLATDDDDAASLTQKKEVTEKEAKEYVFNFGKHKGKKLIDLIEDEDNYIDWLLGNSKDEYLLKCITLLTGIVPPTQDEQEEILNLIVELNDLVRDKGYGYDNIHKHYKVKSTQEMTIEQLKDAIRKVKGVK